MKNIILIVVAAILVVAVVISNTIVVETAVASVTNQNGFDTDVATTMLTTDGKYIGVGEPYQTFVEQHLTRGELLRLERTFWGWHVVAVLSD